MKAPAKIIGRLGYSKDYVVISVAKPEWRNVEWYLLFSSIFQSSNIDWMLICKKIPKNKWNFLERKVEPVGHRCAVNIFFNGWKPTFNKGWRRKNNRSRSKTDRLCNTGGDCVSFTTGQLIDLKSTDLTVLVLNPSVGDFIQRGSQKLFQKLSSGHARFT